MVKSIVLGTAGLAAALTATAASAATSNQTATVEVNATLPKKCTFTSAPSSLVTVTPQAGVKDLGDLGFTCNFSGHADLTLTLPNGTNLKNDENGGDTAPYGIRWTVAPNSPESTGYQSIGAGSIPFAWPGDDSLQPNVERKGALQIKLDNDLKVAGTYKTTITYTIAP